MSRRRLQKVQTLFSPQSPKFRKIDLLLSNWKRKSNNKDYSRILLPLDLVNLLNLFCKRVVLFDAEKDKYFELIHGQHKTVIKCDFCRCNIKYDLIDRELRSKDVVVDELDLRVKMSSINFINYFNLGIESPIEDKKSFYFAVAKFRSPSNPYLDCKFLCCNYYHEGSNWHYRISKGLFISKNTLGLRILKQDSVVVKQNDILSISLSNGKISFKFNNILLTIHHCGYLKGKKYLVGMRIRGKKDRNCESEKVIVETY